MNSKFFSARRITAFAILLALVVVMQALGAIMLGPIAGALLGLACGIVVLIQVIMGLVPFYVLIWTESPFVASLTCLVKTTVAGLVAGILFKSIRKKNFYVAVFVASAIVPIINTALFIVGCLGMWDAMVMIAGGTNILGFIIVSLVTFNFFAELGVNLLCAPALYRVVRAIDKTGNYYADAQENAQDNEE